MQQKLEKVKDAKILSILETREYCKTTFLHFQLFSAIIRPWFIEDFIVLVSKTLVILLS